MQWTALMLLKPAVNVAAAVGLQTLRLLAAASLDRQFSPILREKKLRFGRLCRKVRNLVQNLVLSLNLSSGV
jgi:hypothetical protein